MNPFKKITTKRNLSQLQNQNTPIIFDGGSQWGNFTPIGASANLVAYSTMEKSGHHIGWGRWLKLAIPATFIGLLIANIGILIKLYINFY